jgi:hypothetical protein
MPLPTNPEPWENASEDLSETPWIIINTATPKAFFECERCGESEVPTFPVDMKVFIANINTFVNEHRECEEEEDEICGSCNGSGEGRYDGSTCYSCKGSGEVGKRGPEPDYDALADERRDERGQDEVDWESPE